MVNYYQGNNAKLAEELRWMGIVLRRVKTLPRSEKREIQERLNMWDDLMERDPKMKKIRKESEARGLAEGLQKAVITVVNIALSTAHGVGATEGFTSPPTGQIEPVARTSDVCF